MTDSGDNNPNIHIEGSTFQGPTNFGTQTFYEAVTMTFGNLTATVGGMSAPPDDKVQLQALLNQLAEALKQAPADKQEDAEKVVKRAKEAVEEAVAPKLDKEAVEAKANLLKRAAENVKEAMPVVLTIATNLIAHLLRLGA